MVDLPDGAEEEDTERDGFLSYAGEWHALAVGLAVGLVASVTGRWALAGVVVAAALGVSASKRVERLPALGEVRREPWYALGGLAIGAAVGFVVPFL